MGDVTVVIPTWNGCDLLRKTLPTVLAQAGVSFSVIIVDNGSSADDQTYPFIQSLEDDRITYLQFAEPLGYAAAVNRGVEAAKTDILVVLGNDNICPKDWLQNLTLVFARERYQQKPIGAVMARTEMSILDTSYRGTMNIFGRNVMFADSRWQTEALPIFYPGGNAVVFRKSVVRLPYEDFYFTYQEDVFLGWRLRNRGYEVLHYYPAYVNSFDGGTTKRIRFRTEFFAERNRWLNLLIFPEMRSILFMLPFWSLDYFLRLLLSRSRTSKFVAGAWLVWNIRFVWRLRMKYQAERQCEDQEVFSAMSPLYFSETQYTSGAKKMVNCFFASYCQLVLPKIGWSLFK